MTLISQCNMIAGTERGSDLGLCAVQKAVQDQTRKDYIKGQQVLLGPQSHYLCSCQLAQWTEVALIVSTADSFCMCVWCLVCVREDSTGELYSLCQRPQLDHNYLVMQVD